MSTRTRYVVMTLAALLPLGCTFAATLIAQTPPPITRMVLSPQASRFLDSLANDARENRRENGGCIGAYAVRDSVIHVERIDAASYATADSVSIGVASGTVGICPEGVPTIHSHVAWQGKTPPSQIDRETARYRGTWNALLSVRENGWLLVIY